MKKKKPKTAFSVLFILIIAPALLSAAGGDEIKYRREFEIIPGKDLKIEIDVDAATVEIAPNERTREVSISLYYTEDAFDYDIDFNERSHRLFIAFEKKDWMKSEKGHLKAELRILLPSESTLDVVARIKAGEVEMDLGGLSIRRFVNKIWAGEVNIDFDQPNRVPMSWLEINTKVGETVLRRLGNARFRFAEINSGVGELNIDFSGDMHPDASAEIDLDIGETSIYLPEDLGVKMNVRKFLFLSQVDVPFGFEKMGKYYVSENFDTATKKLDLKIKTGIGQLNIRLR